MVESTARRDSASCMVSSHLDTPPCSSVDRSWRRLDWETPGSEIVLEQKQNDSWTQCTMMGDTEASSVEQSLQSFGQS